jgi:hypothetical protein
MPDLLHTLQGNDLGFLRMIANAWGIELNAPDAYTALPLLVKAINSRVLIHEIVETLPTEAQSALQALLENEGKLSWALFCRRYGEVRAMGAAKRDRERPDLKPASPAEMLWYRALISKAFLNLPPEPQEFAYIPDDLLVHLTPLSKETLSAWGRAASPVESAAPIPATDDILDHACTLLAALRMGMDLSTLDESEGEIPLNCLRQLLISAHLVNGYNVPDPEKTRVFLEAERGEALSLLARAWFNSTTFNDLRLLPGLLFEGDWVNDPLTTRQSILEMISHLPQGTWWSLSAFIASVRERHPDFQRPAGDYDSWFIRHENSEEYLRGFSSWDEIDAALLRFIITGPMHWLGIMDLAIPESSMVSGIPVEKFSSTSASAFRPSPWSIDLWHGKAPSAAAETELLHIMTNGVFSLPHLFPRAARYQIARFCSWEGVKEGEYRYRLTPTALAQARQNGLQPAQLVNLLRRYAANPIPPNLLKALKRWETSGIQARINPVILLRLSSAEILNELRQTRAGRFLGDVLNPSTVIIKPGGEEIVRTALTEIGYIGEFESSAGINMSAFPDTGE